MKNATVLFVVKPVHKYQNLKVLLLFLQSDVIVSLETASLKIKVFRSYLFSVNFN